MRALTLNMTSIFTGLMSVELIGSIACWVDPAATTNLPRVNRPSQIAKGLSEGEVTEKKRTLEEGDWGSGEKLRKGSKHFSPVSPLLQCFLSLSRLYPSFLLFLFPLSACYAGLGSTRQNMDISFRRWSGSVYVPTGQSGCCINYYSWRYFPRGGVSTPLK